MTIGAMNGMGMRPEAAMKGGNGGQMDAVSKDLKNQIENLQKQIKEISSNQEMPTEVKMKKRQELQKQISELEMQLRQHQMEVRREEIKKKQENGTSMEEMTGGKRRVKKGEKQNAGLSAGSMESIILADASMKQADVQGSTARKMEGRAGALEAEINLDKSRGGSTELKEKELAGVKAAAQQASASQMQSLSQANKTMQEEDEDEEGSDKADGAADGGKPSEGAEPGMAAKEDGEYHPVDVRI